MSSVWIFPYPNLPNMFMNQGQPESQIIHGLRDILHFVKNFKTSENVIPPLLHHILCGLIMVLKWVQYCSTFFTFSGIANSLASYIFNT